MVNYTPFAKQYDILNSKWGVVNVIGIVALTWLFNANSKCEIMILRLICFFAARLVDGQG